MAAKSPRKKGAVKNKKKIWVSWYIFDFFAILFLFSLFVADFLIPGGDQLGLDIIGFIVLATSLPFVYFPFFHLRHYGLVEEGHQYMETNRMVTEGIYQVIRHPQYLGYILLAAGFIFIGQHPIMTALGSLSIILFVIHSFKEENTLRQRFGQAYETYRLEVPRFNFLLGIIRLRKRKRQKAS